MVKPLPTADEMVASWNDVCRVYRQHVSDEKDPERRESFRQKAIEALRALGAPTYAISRWLDGALNKKDRRYG